MKTVVAGESSSQWHSMVCLVVQPLWWLWLSTGGEATELLLMVAGCGSSDGARDSQRGLWWWFGCLVKELGGSVVFFGILVVA